MTAAALQQQIGIQSAAAEGTDRLTGIEQLQFADGIIDVPAVA